MVAIVTLVFSICWLPITFYIMSANFFANKTASLYYFKMIANSFAYLNSAVNPIIYAFLNRSFRNNCGNILSKPVCCRKSYQKQEQQRKSCHKPTICYLTKEKNIIIDNNNQLLVNDALSGDFSDAEYETPDLDCLPDATIDGTENENSCFENQRGIILISTKHNGDRSLTTSL
jgi:hypothetical protein